MSPERLVQQTAELEPLGVPSLLTRHVALIIDERPAIYRHFTEQAAAEPKVQFRIALAWLLAFFRIPDLWLTDGAASPRLSDFGAHFLACFSFEQAGCDDLAQITAPYLRASLCDDHLDRLVATLADYLGSDGVETSTVHVLALLVRTLLRHAATRLTGTLPRLLVVADWSAAELRKAIAAGRSATNRMYFDTLINLHQASHDALPEGSPDRAHRRDRWATALLLRYLASDEPADLDAAIAGFAIAASSLPVGSSELNACRGHWAGALICRYERWERIEDLQDALSLFRSAKPQDGEDPRLVALHHTNHASALTKRYEAGGSLADLDEAIALLRQAEPLVADDLPTQTTCRHHLATALIRRYEARGEFADLESALALFGRLSSHPPQPPHDRALLRMDWAIGLQCRYEVLRDPADLDAALERYAEALPGLEDDPRNRALCLVNWATALVLRYRDQRDPDDLERAQRQLRGAAACLPEGSPTRAQCLVNLASTLTTQFALTQGTSDLDDAALLLDQAEASLPDQSLGLARCWMLQGLVLEDRARDPGSDTTRERALAKYRAAESIFRAAGALLSRAEALTTMARLQQRCGDWRGAFASLGRAIRAWEHGLLGLLDQEQQLQFLSREGALYAKMVLTCLVLSSEAKVRKPALSRRLIQYAWRYAERTRARLTVQYLQRALAESATVEHASHSPELLREYAELRQAVLMLLTGEQSERAAGTRSFAITPEVAAERTSAARALDARLTRVRAELAQRDRLFAPLQEIARSDLSAIQGRIQVIPEHAVLLEFSVLNGQLCAFALDGRRVEFLTFDAGEQELLEWTARFRRFLGMPDPAPHAFAAELERALGWLGFRLWPGLRSCLPSRITVADERVPHVIMVPSGPLHHWPLAALPIPGTDERLVDRYAITVLPSADVLVRRGAPPLGGEHRAFAPPVGDLPFAVPSARYAAAKLGGYVHDGADASLDTLAALGEGGILTFATHALVLLDRPLLSHLLLAGRHQAIEPVTTLDILLELRRLRSPLIALLACEVHADDAGAGDNWVGLSHSFLARTHALITSLWAIDDAATLALTIPLWDALGRGLTMPQALRVATRALRDAERATLLGWGERVATALPTEEVAGFLRAWRRAVAARAAAVPGRPPFGDLATWAPYLAIGQPDPIHLLNRVAPTPLA